MPARAPADLRLPQGAGHGARAGRVGSATLRPLEREGSGGQAPAEDVGFESVGDPVEEGERRLARVSESRGDAAGERAVETVLAGQLPDERGVGGGVGVEDLDLVERDLLLEDAAEHLADLVLFAARAEEARRRCDFEPALRRRGGETPELRTRDLLEDLALHGGQIRVVDDQEQRSARIRRRGPERPAQHGGGVDETALPPGSRRSARGCP